MIVGEILGWLFALLAAVGCAYTVASLIFVVRFFRSALAASKGAVADPFRGAVSIVKPLHGWEPGLRDSLETFFVQRTAASFEVVLGVQDAEDPAIRIAEAVIADHPATRSKVFLNTDDHGHNRKISNVINILTGVEGDVVVLSDSDIGVPADYLERVLGELMKPGVGVVTCPYYGKGEAGFWSKFAAMGQTYGFLPNVITGVSLGLAKPCMGSTVALRRETLEKIGGFAVFQDVLADDYAIGAAVRQLGLKSVVAPVLVSHSCTEETLGGVISHELRWARTVKGLDPAGYAGSVITNPTPLAIIAAALLGFSAPSLVLLGTALVVRIGLAIALDRVIGRRGGALWLSPARDLTTFVVFLGSFLVRDVEWRGTKFHVTANGDLIRL